MYNDFASAPDDCALVLILFVTLLRPSVFFFFFFNDTATTEIYTLSLHDALPIYGEDEIRRIDQLSGEQACPVGREIEARSEEHTSELQSRLHLVCRLLLEKKKKSITNNTTYRTIINDRSKIARQRQTDVNSVRVS